MINGIKLSQLCGLHDEDLIAAMLLTHPEKVTVHSWTGTELSEIEASSAKALRSEMLYETDIWALTDRVMSVAQESYRQALRDVPQQSGFPHDVAWPVNP
jgi:hypothetical protein